MAQLGAGLYPEINMLWPERQGRHENVNTKAPYLFISQDFLRKGPLGIVVSYTMYMSQSDEAMDAERRPEI